MSSKPLIFSFVAALALLLGACASSPDSRIAQDRELFESWPQEVQEKVAVGVVGLGFTPDQVRMAMGDPTRVTRRVSSGGESEVWIYEERDPVNFSIGLGMGTSTGRRSGVGGGVVLSPGQTRAGEAARIIFSEGVVGSIEKSER